MSEIHFGTDGWRAIIGKDFNVDNLIKVSHASALAFREKYGSGTIYIGHDCREDAHRYAQIAAGVVAEQGFDVKLTDKYCPTPTLCWTVAHDNRAIGGIILTSSHNSGEYLGVKLRMKDGGASPQEFTDRVEEIIDSTADTPAFENTNFVEVDIMTPYLASLKSLVDAESIRNANLSVVLDPLYGAARIYLAQLLEDMGVNVVEINNAEDPTFDGLHPEPVPPWVDRGLAKVKEVRADALFINDGDADRIAAGDRDGNFINPHRVIMLITKHLYNKGGRGRVVSTVTASALLGRLCDRLGLELTSTPVGFKWIYEQMQHGDVMVGGEESGGIGIPDHVMERDGLLMALLLTELMAQSGKDLGTLVVDLLSELGTMEFERRGLTVTDNQMDNFKNSILPSFESDEVCGLPVKSIDRRDGIKLCLEDDGWVMMRPSGTEPLVRIYAEAPTTTEVDKLLMWAQDTICI